MKFNRKLAIIIPFSLVTVGLVSACTTTSFSLFNNDDSFKNLNTSIWKNTSSTVKQGQKQYLSMQQFDTIANQKLVNPMQKFTYSNSNSITTDSPFQALYSINIPAMSMKYSRFNADDYPTWAPYPNDKGGAGNIPNAYDTLKMDYIYDEDGNGQNSIKEGYQMLVVYAQNAYDARVNAASSTSKGNAIILRPNFRVPSLFALNTADSLKDNNILQEVIKATRANDYDPLKFNYNEDTEVNFNSSDIYLMGATDYRYTSYYYTSLNPDNIVSGTSLRPGSLQNADASNVFNSLNYIYQDNYLNWPTSKSIINQTYINNYDSFDNNANSIIDTSLVGISPNPETNWYLLGNEDIQNGNKKSNFQVTDKDYQMNITTHTLGEYGLYLGLNCTEGYFGLAQLQVPMATESNVSGGGDKWNNNYQLRRDEVRYSISDYSNGTDIVFKVRDMPADSSVDNNGWYYYWSEFELNDERSEMMFPVKTVGRFTGYNKSHAISLSNTTYQVFYGYEYEPSYYNNQKAIQPLSMYSLGIWTEKDGNGYKIYQQIPQNTYEVTLNNTSSTPPWSTIKASDFINNLELLRDAINVTYSEWDTRFTRSDVSYTTNDDAGTVTLEITPGPKMVVNNNYDNIDAFTWVTEFATSDPITITISGFSSSVTQWGKTTIQYTNASKYIASKNITLDDLKKDLWNQIQRDGDILLNYKNSNNEIKITDLVVESYEEINAAKGYIKVNVYLKKALTDNGWETGKLLPQTITFTGFQQLTGQTTQTTPYFTLTDTNINVNQLNDPTYVQKLISDNILTCFKNADQILIDNNLQVNEVYLNKPNARIYVSYSLTKTYKLDKTDNSAIISNESIKGMLIANLDSSIFGSTNYVWVNSQNQTTNKLNNNQVWLSNNSLYDVSTNQVISNIEQNQFVNSVYYNDVTNKYISLGSSNEDDFQSFNIAANDNSISVANNANAIDISNYLSNSNLKYAMKLLPIYDMNNSISQYLVLPIGPWENPTDSQDYDSLNNVFLYKVAQGNKSAKIYPLSLNYGVNGFIQNAAARTFIYDGYEFMSIVLDVVDIESRNIITLSSLFLVFDGVPEGEAYETKIDGLETPIQSNIYEFAWNDTKRMQLCDGYDYDVASSKYAYANNAYLWSDILPYELVYDIDESTFPEINNNPNDIDIPRGYEFSLLRSDYLINDKDGFEKYQLTLTNNVWNRDGNNISYNLSSKQKSIKIGSTWDGTKFGYVTFNNFLNNNMGTNSNETNYQISYFPNIHYTQDKKYLYMNLGVRYIDNYDLKNANYTLIINTNDLTINAILSPFGTNSILMPDQLYNNVYVAKNQLTKTDINTPSNFDLIDSIYRGDSPVIELKKNIYDYYSLYQTQNNNLNGFIDYLLSTSAYAGMRKPFVSEQVSKYYWMTYDYKSKISDDGTSFNNKSEDALFDPANVTIDPLNINFDFEKNIIDVVYNFDQYLQTDGSIGETSIKLQFKPSGNAVNAVTNVKINEQQWANISADASAVQAKIDELNKLSSEQLISYFTITNNANSISSKPVASKVELVSLDLASAKMQISMQLDKAFVKVNNQIILQENVTYYFEVSLVPTNPSIPTSIQIKDTQFTSLNASNIVNEIYSDSSIGSGFVKYATQAIADEMNKNGQVISASEIVLSKNWNFNTSRGEVWTYVSIPNWASDINGTSPYLQQKVVFTNLRKLEPTSVLYINDQINATQRNIKPSDLQDFLNENWWNIYYFVALTNVVGQTRGNWIPYLYDYANGFIDNNNFNPSSLPQDPTDIYDQNTNITAIVLNSNDQAGTAEVKLLLRNFYSDQDNISLDPTTNAPYPDSVKTITLTFEGLRTTGDNGFKTEAKASFNAPQNLQTFIPWQLTTTENENLLKQAIIDNGLNYPPSLTINDIKILNLVSNNKDGQIYVEFSLAKVIDNSDQTIPCPDNIVFNTTINKLTSASPTKITINTSEINLSIDELVNKIFDPNTQTWVNENSIELFKNIVSITNAPQDWEKEIKGKVVNIDYQNNSAQLIFSLKHYYLNDKFVTYATDLEYSITIKSTVSNKLSVYAINTNDTNSTNQALINPYLINENWSEDKQINLIILLTCLSTLSLVIPLTLYWYHKVKNKKVIA